MQWYAVVAKMLVLSAKTAGFIFFMMWIRWTLPRFRYDQLMRLAWQKLVPISLAIFVLATFLVYLGHHRSPLWALSGNGMILVIVILIAAAERTEITGRQPNLPPVTVPGAPGFTL
jgi:hypothetical protein